MRISLVGPHPPLRGGVAQHTARLAGALAELGHDVGVVSWRSQYPALLYKGTRVDTGDTNDPLLRFELQWWNPRSWRRVGRSIRTADLVVIQWITAFHALPLRQLLGAAGRPAVAVVHNAIPHEWLPFSRSLTRAALRRVGAFVVHAGSVADDLARILGNPRVAIVPHPPNLHVEPSPLPDGDPPALLFLGFVRPYKGVDVAIEAVARLRSRGRPVRLTVAGEFWGPVDRYSDLAGRLGVADLVELRNGYAPDGEVLALLRNHHLVVTPYRTATQSGIVPLAFAAGRPVVSTTAGGLGERVTEGVNGALAPPEDADAFADAVERALDHIDHLAEGALATRTSWADVARAVAPEEEQE